MSQITNDPEKKLSARQRLVNGGSLHWIHWAVIVFSLGLTIGAWKFSEKQVSEKIEERFDREAGHLVELVVITHILDIAVFEVDLLHIFRPTADCRQHLSQGRRHRIGIDRCACYFCQQGMKHHMVFAVEEHNVARVGLQPFAQGFSAFDTGETATDDNDTCCGHI